MSILRAIAVLMALWMGVGMLFEIRKGVLRIGEEETATLLRRDERPVAFWSFVAAFYMAMALMIAGAVLL